jgi:hypothetical protein
MFEEERTDTTGQDGVCRNLGALGRGSVFIRDKADMYTSTPQSMQCRSRINIADSLITV